MSKLVNYSRGARNLCVISFFALLLLAGACNKEQQVSSSNPKKGAAAPDVAPKLEGQTSILSHLPKSTFAFYLVDTSHAGYQKYKDSPWAGSGGGQRVSDALLKSQGNLGDVATAMTKAGFDLDNLRPEDLGLEKILFYVTHEDSSLVVSSFATIKEPEKINQRLAKLKKELADTNIKTQEIEFENGEGLHIESNAQAPDVEENDETEDVNNPGLNNAVPRSVYIAWNSSRLVGSSSKEETQRMLLSDGTSSMPEVVQSERFKQASAMSLSPDAIYAFGYADLQRAVAKTSALSEMPFEAVYFAQAMKDTPQAKLKLTYDKAQASSSAWLSDLSGSTLSAISKHTLQPNPVFVFSLDGKAVSSLAETAVKYDKTGASAAAVPFVQMVKSIARITIAASSAPQGQSLLPVPDLLILADTEQAVPLRDQLLNVIAGAMGMGGIQPPTETIEGFDVRSIDSGLGLGAYFAASDKGLVVASSRRLLATSLQDLKNESSKFANTLAPQMKQSLLDQSSLATAYVDFTQLSKLLESLKGVMLQYVPAGSDEQQTLDDQIVQMRSYGTMLWSVSHNADGYFLTDMYVDAPKHQQP